MKKLFFISVVFLLTFSCYDRGGEFPPESLIIKVEKIRFYKGQIFINDTINFTGAYYKNFPELDLDKDILYNQLKVNDSIIVDNNPKKYVTRRRKGKDVIFYTWPHNL